MAIENNPEVPENGNGTSESPIFNSIDRSLWGHVGDLAKKFSAPKKTVESANAEKTPKNELDDILSMIIGIIQNMDKDERKKFILFFHDEKGGTFEELKMLVLKYFQEGYMELVEANRKKISTETNDLKNDQDQPGKLEH